MAHGRIWTPEEIEYLQEKWGCASVKRIAEQLQRTECAVLLKASRLKLGAHLENGEYVIFHQLLLTLGKSSGYTYYTDMLVRKGLKIRKHKVRNHSYRVVDLDDFWAFAEKNKELFDFSKFEKNSLGAEPEWVSAKRNEDIKKSREVKPHNEVWTPAEDKELLRLLKMHRYSYAELEQRLKRTAGAIQKRVCDLGVKERPIKAYTHDMWTKAQEQELKKMIIGGSGYTVIAKQIGKSTKAIQGKIYRTYGTERLDKVRERINTNG